MRRGAVVPFSHPDTRLAETGRLGEPREAQPARLPQPPQPRAERLLSIGSGIGFSPVGGIEIGGERIAQPRRAERCARQRLAKAAAIEPLALPNDRGDDVAGLGQGDRYIVSHRKIGGGFDQHAADRQIVDDNLRALTGRHRARHRKIETQAIRPLLPFARGGLNHRSVNDHRRLLVAAQGKRGVNAHARLIRFVRQLGRAGDADEGAGGRSRGTSGRGCTPGQAGHGDFLFLLFLHPANRNGDRQKRPKAALCCRDSPHACPAAAQKSADTASNVVHFSVKKLTAAVSYQDGRKGDPRSRFSD